MMWRCCGCEIWNLVEWYLNSGSRLLSGFDIFGSVELGFVVGGERVFVWRVSVGVIDYLWC